MTTSRVAGLFYLVTFVAGTVALVVRAGPDRRRDRHDCRGELHRGDGAAVCRLQTGRQDLMLEYLLFRSTSAPRALAPLVAFAGLGWLTFASPALANTLYPYNFAPGIIGEGALAIWLLSA